MKTEQRPLYGIGTVSRLAGIKPDTLRVWERRYGLGASQKSDTGRRQYTQTDLEHLQIVSRLVEDGYRIGEIAAMGKKTLAALLEQGTGNGRQEPDRPQALFVGIGLCSWLDRHPGCLSSLDSSLLRTELPGDDVMPDLQGKRLQMLVVELPALNAEHANRLLAFRDRLEVSNCAVFYEFASERTLSLLTAEGVHCTQAPLDTQKFAGTIKQLVGVIEVERGIGDAGELVSTQPRLFSDKQLLAVQAAPSSVDCGCSQHLSEIVRSLAHFEEYSSQCSVENWKDAAVHTCVHAYVNQARWLMEKALTAVLEEEESTVEAIAPAA